MAQQTITVNPSSYDNINYSYQSVTSSHPLSTAVGKSSTSTSYAQWTLKTGSRAESYVFYIFDLSSIPQNAVINSVSCSAKGYISNTTSTRVATRQMQMYNGTSTAKGTAVNISTSTSALTIQCGTWTRSELEDCRIRIYAKRGTSSTTTSVNARFYGATLTVVYTVEDKQMMIKVNGQWTNVQSVYKKINGSWVLQDDLENLFDTTTKYLKKN